MKRFLFFTAMLTLSVSACKPAQTETDETVVSDSDTRSASADVAVEVKPGVVRLRLKTPVSEQYACIVPIQLENGLENSTQVSMIGFKVVGPGDDASANMFAPTADAGGITEARVIVQGQGCEAFDTLKIPEIRCTSGEEDCSAKIELIDGEGLRFARTG